MIKKIKCITKFIIKSTIMLITPLDKDTISIIDGTPFSGSNAGALYKFLKNKNSINGTKKYFLINNSDIDIKSDVPINIFINNVIKIAKSKVVLSTHGYRRIKSTQCTISMWHGVPLKSMILMDKTLDPKLKKQGVKRLTNFNKILSSSTFYNTLMNSCIGADSNKYLITGFPRNDFLIAKRNDIYSLITKGRKYDKIISVIPTFRMGYGNRKEGENRFENILGFKNEDFNLLIRYLEEQNILLIFKLHPFEEKVYLELFKNNESKNILFLTQEMLKSNDIDLYQVLPHLDMLITDYSSVYFDFLLCNKPITFMINDIQEYTNTRGLLFDCNDFSMPGDKVKTQEELIISINNTLFNGQDKYFEQREILSDMIHNFKDNQSSQRIYNYIKEIVGE